MRLECELITVREGIHGVGKQYQSKSQRGIIMLGKHQTRDGYRYLFNVSTRTAPRGEPILVTAENVKKVHVQHILSGRAAFVFRDPALSVIIVKSSAPHLRTFIQTFQEILQGADVQIRELEKVKKSDFKPEPKILRVTAENLRTIVYLPSLHTLDMSGLGLRAYNAAWFSLPNLTHLILAQNSLHEEPNPNKLKLLSRLTKLRSLSLEANGIEVLPASFFEWLPLSLLELNLSANRLKSLPPSIVNLRGLDTLNLSLNCLTKIPRDMSDMGLRCLFIDRNEISELPYDLKTVKFEKFYCAGNQLGAVRQRRVHDLPNEVTLCSLAFTAVRRYSLPEMLLPWDISLIADRLSVKCCMCRNWTSAGDFVSFYVRREIDFCIETDFREAVCMHCITCTRCSRKLVRLRRRFRIFNNADLERR